MDFSQSKNPYKLAIPTLSSSTTEDSLTKEFQKCFIDIMQTVKNANSKKDSSLAQDIIDFIESNYQQDLSLTDLAQHFNISIGYIGKMLRENKNTTFRQTGAHFPKRRKLTK